MPVQEFLLATESIAVPKGRKERIRIKERVAQTGICGGVPLIYTLYQHGLVIRCVRSAAVGRCLVPLQQPHLSHQQRQQSEIRENPKLNSGDELRMYVLKSS